jgi:hypothetical protein
MFWPRKIGLLFEHQMEEDIAPLVRKDMVITLFLATVVEKTLLLGQSIYVTRKSVSYVYDLEKT